MYIGYAKNAKYSYKYAETDVAIVPEITDDGVIGWKWETLYSIGLDIHVELEDESYVGAFTLPFKPKGRAFGVEVFIDGSSVGKHLAETGKTIGGRVTVPMGVMAKNFVVRVYASNDAIIFSEPEIAIAYDDGNPLIWPTPEKANFGEGSVYISKIATKNSCEDECVAADFLSERIAERFGDCLCEKCGVAVTIDLDKSEEYLGERFTVSVSKDGITLKAGKRIALMYAINALISVGNEGKFRICEIDDKPAKEMRGVHIGLPAKHNLEFAKRLYRYVFLALGYNQLYVEFCGGMRFDRHPEISEAWLEGNKKAKLGLQPTFPHDYMGAEGGLLEKDEVRDILSYARYLGFEIIPEVQSFGHVQYITAAHPEIGEREECDKIVDDERAEDVRPDNFFTHCYCPSNEKSYEIIFDLIDEIVEVACPERFVHIGHDEIYHIGLCPRCKDTPHDVLYNKHFTTLHDYVAKKGLRTMFWSDMIQPVTKYQTPGAIDMIPKDVVCLDFIWYFHLDKDIEENLLAKDFKVMAGNLYSSHYPRYRKRMLAEGMIGGEVSTWCAVDEYKLGKKGKFWDFTYTAEMLWKPADYDENMREVYGYVISKYIQPIQRDLIRGKYSVSGYECKSFALPEGKKDRIPAAVLSARPDAIIANGSTVKLSGKCDRLLIETGTLKAIQRFAWKPLIVVGDFTVKYADGDTVTFPLEYAGNTQAISRRYGDPMREGYHRHTGYIGTWFSNPTLEAKTCCGNDVLLTEFVWENPNPEKEISEISYASREGDIATAVLTAVKAAKAKN